jgi:hypothetical protein
MDARNRSVSRMSTFDPSANYTEAHLPYWHPIIDPRLETRLFRNYIHFSIDRPPKTLTRTISGPTLTGIYPIHDPDFHSQHQLYEPDDLILHETQKQNPRSLPDYCNVPTNKYPRKNLRLARSFSFTDVLSDLSNPCGHSQHAPTNKTPVKAVKRNRQSRHGKGQVRYLDWSKWRKSQNGRLSAWYGWEMGGLFGV